MSWRSYPQMRVRMNDAIRGLWRAHKRAPWRQLRKSTRPECPRRPPARPVTHTWTRRAVGATRLDPCSSIAPAPFETALIRLTNVAAGYQRGRDRRLISPDVQSLLEALGVTAVPRGVLAGA